MTIKIEDVQGHVYEPAKDGFPFVGVVICPGQAPTLRSYESKEKADADVELLIRIMRHGIITDRKL